jgi:Na+:H+ antiporter
LSNKLEYIGLLLAVTAGFAYANHHLLRLPRNSGLLVIALAFSVCLRLIEQAFPSVGLATLIRDKLGQANLGPLLLDFFLGFLLFAGALNVDVNELRARKWTILALSTVGVLLSTLAIAGGMFGVFALCGVPVPFSYCLVFGALISPTDPVTVLGVLSRLNVPKRLQAVIAGESLFNDGIGIALFTIFLDQAMSSGTTGNLILGGALEFVRQAGGGVLLGLAAGGLAFAAMRGIDEYNVELMISLALVACTYGVAQSLGVSGPVAMVVAGLLMGSIGVKYAVSGTTHDYLQKFWSLTDELLNALLFMLMGLEFAAIELQWGYIAATALAIPLALLARGLSIAAASLPLHLGSPDKSRAVALLTWSGLRGGIAVALALSLPANPYREELVTAAYGIAIFTMVAQGLSLGRIASWLYPPDKTNT